MYIAGYQEGYWYWEGIVLARKLSLAAMGVFLASSSSYSQGLTAIFILSVSLVLQLSCNPYQDTSLNKLEALGLGCGTLTLFFGLWTFERESAFTEEIGLGASVVIFFINGVWLIIALGAIFEKYISKCFARMCGKRRNRVNAVEGVRGVAGGPVGGEVRDVELTAAADGDDEDEKDEAGDHTMLDIESTGNSAFTVPMK